MPLEGQFLGERMADLVHRAQGGTCAMTNQEFKDTIAMLGSVMEEPFSIISPARA